MTRLHGSEYRAAKADVMSLTATTETVSLSDMTDLQRGLRRALFPIMSKIFMTSAAVTCLQFLGNASQMCWRQTVSETQTSATRASSAESGITGSIVCQ